MRLQADVQDVHLASNHERSACYSHCEVILVRFFKLYRMFLCCRQLGLVKPAVMQELQPERITDMLGVTPSGLSIGRTTQKGRQPDNPILKRHKKVFGALPELVVLHILNFLPDIHKAGVAKLVCKQAYKTLQQYKTIQEPIVMQLPPVYLLGLIKPFASKGLRQQLIAAIAKHGDLNGLQLLRLHGCEWDKEACSQGAASGHLPVLQCLRRQHPPCPWDHAVCAAAALGGHLEVVQWARAQTPPCDWDEYACMGAAYGGHMDLLKWLTAQQPPAPLTSKTCAAAADRGHLDILVWLRAQEPPAPWAHGTIPGCSDLCISSSPRSS